MNAPIPRPTLAVSAGNVLATCMLRLVASTDEFLALLQLATVTSVDWRGAGPCTASTLVAEP